MAGRFLEALAAGPLVADGAMGTELYRRGFPFSTRYEALNLTHPEVVREIHAEYAAAGARVHTTNTFGLTRDPSDAVAIARAAVAVMPVGAIVAGSIGPGTAYEEAVDALAEAGVDVLEIETMMDVTNLARAIAACKRTGLPIIAHAAAPIDLAQMIDLGADVVGFNCLDPDAIAELAPIARYVSVAPSAGLPIAGVYPWSPERFAARTLRANMIGGCCGTTPAHIRALTSR